METRKLNHPTSFKNLGVEFDVTLSFKKHVKNICTKSYIQLRKIQNIRNYFTPNTTETIMHAFVTSTLDYCNSLLYGLPDITLHKL